MLFLFSTTLKRFYFPFIRFFTLFIRKKNQPNSFIPPLYRFKNHPHLRRNSKASFRFRSFITIFALNFMKLHIDMATKPIIYQMLPRLFSNLNPNCVPNGTIEQNGSGKLNYITPTILRSIRDLGATHIWLTGVIEHAQKTDYSRYGIMPDNPYVVKGEAGSPYAIKDYYDIDPDIALDVPNRMAEFEDTVARIHRAGMKVIIDFVPNHVARCYHSDARPADAPGDFGCDDDTTKFFSPCNNFYYIPKQRFAPSIPLGSGENEYIEFPAKATGNDCFTAFPGVCDWYETVKLNYGVDYGDGSRHFVPIPDTWMKMLHILLYWAGKGVDGFRCDMAHMVPLEFWQWAINLVKVDYPNIIFIAEIYDVNLYWSYINIGGFDYLYDKVNLYDTLRAIQTSNHSAARLTDCWQRLGDMEPHMLNFLENHDEQRFASAQYAGRADVVMPSLVVAATLGRSAMMIYAGQELGEKGADAEGFSGADGRTTIFDYWSIPTLRRWLSGDKPSLKNLSAFEQQLRRNYKRVLNIARTEPAITDGDMFDLMYVNLSNPCFDPHRQFAFLRHKDDESIMIVVNFDNKDVDISIDIPDHAFDYLSINEGPRKAVELLTDTEMEIDFSRSIPFKTTIPANGAVMWKLTESKSE